MIVSLVNSRSHPRQATRYPSSWNALSPQWTCQCPLLLLCFQQLPTIKWNYPARMVHPGRSAGSLCLFEADTTKPFVPFCFQQLITIKFCSPFVLITIQFAGGWQGSSPFACVPLCKFAPLFSITSRMPLPQPLSFQAFASLPGVSIPLQQKDSKPCTSTRYLHKGRYAEAKGRRELTRKVFLFGSLLHHVLTSLLRSTRRNSSRSNHESRWLLCRKTVCSSTKSSRMTRQPRLFSAARSTVTGVAPSARYRRATTGEITCRLASTQSITRRGTCF